MTSVTREYYIAAVEVNWNYAPVGKNVVEGRAWSADEQPFVVPAPDVPQIGNVYRKAIYVEYTDATFSTPKPRADEWQHLGIMGPPIRATVGDTIKVTFKNMAAVKRFSMHPHGVHYLKDSEGAPYNDGTSGSDTQDDAVAPGATALYTWFVPDTAGPGSSDSSTHVWLYHSHQNELKNTNAGLVGPIIITAAGQAKSASDPSPVGIDREFVIFPNVFDESDSDYINENIAAYTTAPVTGGGGGPPPYRRAADAGEAAFSSDNAVRSTASTFVSSFRKSNLKATINGYLFGNGADHFNMAEGETVRFHVISLGSYNTEFVDSFDALGSLDGFNTVRFHGHTFAKGSSFDHSELRSQVVTVLPASMHSVDVKMVNPGTWMIQCVIGYHTEYGMSTLYTVTPNAAKATPLGLSGTIRTYYLAAEEVEWDYAPSGKDQTTGVAFSDPSTSASVNRMMVQTDLLIGRTYRKAVFRRYTGPDFQTRWTSGNSDYDHMGILGSPLYFAVGDEGHIVFKNMLTIPASLNPFGVHVNKANEGLSYADGSTDHADDTVAPGGTFTYTWYFPSWTGPATDDGSSIVWMYQSGTDLFRDSNAGLIGPIVVTRASSAASSGDPRPTDVGRELFVFSMMFNENNSPYIDHNIAAYTTAGSSTVLANPFFASSNWMFSLNGLAFANLPPMTANSGERVRIYFMSHGTIDGSIHAIHFHGQSYGQYSHLHKDLMEMLPGLSRTVDISPQNPGRFRVECHSYAHGIRGMQAFFDVSGASITQSGLNGATRTYFIAANEVQWNYVPLGKNNITNRPLGSGQDNRETWLVKSSVHIGPVSLKAVYQQYTDATFSTQVTRTAEWEHLGIMGPPIRAVVGDTITVVFKNNARYPLSMHPQGLLYTKSNEGDGGYIDGDNSPDQSVAPGATATYTWFVPSSAGPGPADPSSIAWAYYSRTSLEHNEVDSGLVGPIIITRQGSARSSSDPTPSGVDREFVSLFSIFREAESLFYQDTLNLLGLQASLQETGSDQRSTINGRMYGNSGGFLMNADDKVRWYILSTGSFDGVHSPHWHGITIVETGHRTDVTELLPTSSRTVDLIADNPGTWLAHCHVSDHMSTGMIHLFTISGTPAPPSVSTSAGSSLALFSNLWILVISFLVLLVLNF